MAGRRFRWRRLVVGLVLAAALVAGGLAAAIATGLLLHDTATAVSIADVVAQFRSHGEAAGRRDGVYRYVTRGDESVDALGGARHRYPQTTTITVVDTACGLRLEWQPLEERSATWTLCSTARGVELRGFSVSHRFFGQGDTTAYACDSVLLPVHQSAGTASPFHCRSHRGREAGSTRVIGFDEMDVHGAALNGVHVRTTAHVSGGDHGTEITDWWFGVRDGLPLRIDLRSRTSRGFFLGTIHYREDASVRLLSTTPLR